MSRPTEPSRSAGSHDRPAPEPTRDGTAGRALPRRGPGPARRPVGRRTGKGGVRPSCCGAVTGGPPAHRRSAPACGYDLRRQHGPSRVAALRHAPPGPLRPTTHPAGRPGAAGPEGIRTTRRPQASARTASARPVAVVARITAGRGRAQARADRAGARATLPRPVAVALTAGLDSNACSRQRSARGPGGVPAWVRRTGRRAGRSRYGPGRRPGGARAGLRATTLRGLRRRSTGDVPGLPPAAPGRGAHPVHSLSTAGGRVVPSYDPQAVAGWVRRCDP